MKTPKPIQRVQERVNQMPLRQRALLLVALLAVVFLIVDALYFRPQAERRDAVQSQLERTGERLDQLTSSLQGMAEQANRNPDEALLARQQRATEQLVRVERELAGIGGGLAQPDRAMSTLRQLLTRRDGARLVELTKLPTENLLGDDSAIDSPIESAIFIHRFRLVFDARFEPALDYLELVESLPRGLYLDTMRLDVDEWPTGRVEMLFYSLTLSEGWLGV